MEADDLLCSRNARPEKGLVGRAQWKINQPPIPEEITSELGRGVARQLAWSLCSQSPHDEAVVARCAQWRPPQPPRRIRVKSREIVRSMRAVKGSLGHSPKER